MREDTTSPPPTKRTQMQLTYKELQSKLKASKEQGYQLNVKLNAKQDVLQKEWERITTELESQAQEALTPAVEARDVCQSQSISAVLPAMTASAPTWLKQQHKVFYIDNGCGYEQDYLMYEVNQWLRDNQGAACEVKLTTESIKATVAKASLWGGGYDLPNVIAAAVVVEEKECSVGQASTSEAQPSMSSITRLLGLVMAAVYLIGLSLCSKSWQGLKALAAATKEPTCTQAIQNAEWFSRCALAFILGLAEGGGDSMNT